MRVATSSCRLNWGRLISFGSRMRVATAMDRSFIHDTEEFCVQSLNDSIFPVTGKPRIAFASAGKQNRHGVGRGGSLPFEYFCYSTATRSALVMIPQSPDARFTSAAGAPDWNVFSSSLALASSLTTG